MSFYDRAVLDESHATRRQKLLKRIQSAERRGDHAAVKKAKATLGTWEKSKSPERETERETERKDTERRARGESPSTHSARQRAFIDKDLGVKPLGLPAPAVKKPRIGGPPILGGIPDPARQRPSRRKPERRIIGFRDTSRREESMSFHGRVFLDA